MQYRPRIATLSRMKCGRFSDDGLEYVITDPATPRPWHNYLVNERYLVNLTQLGTGSSFCQPTGEGLRVNITEDPTGDGGPRFVYLRDNDSGRYWSLTGAPGLPEFERWECRVGLGYQVMLSRCRGVEALWRVFVPQTDDTAELWTVTIANPGDRPRRLSVFPYLEMHLTGGSTLMDFISVLGGFYDEPSRAVFGVNKCVKFPPSFKAILAADAPVAGATAGRAAFVGPYRDYHRPLAVERGDVHAPEAGTEWLGASLRHEVVLPPGASATFNWAVGAVDSIDAGRALARRLLAAGEPERLFAALRDETAAVLRRNTVQTGDAQFDRWMNVWLKHQLRFVRRWGRVIGRGFRDILQDTFGHRFVEPDRARACILEVFSKQYPSGKCIRAWRLPTAQLDLQDYADSPSWMVMALAQYLKETADYGILDEPVPFLDPANPCGPPAGAATVWEHVVLAQGYLLSELGSHGLSKIRYGDWCDTMNGVGARGRGESVMLSMQVKWGCDLLAELADRLGRAGLAASMRDAAQRLARQINAVAWDGEWYVRAFDDDGVAVGSGRTAGVDGGEGRIFLNAQSWAVISGVADPARAAACLASARRHLDTGYGMILNAPPYTALRPRIGQITAQTPGFYENGSVYVHGNCFWVQALAMSGRGAEAWEALRALLPDTPNKPNADTEPFVIPNFYIGPACPRRAQQNLYLSGWRTGSAAWLYMTCLEWVLGARAEYDGLRIDPKLPSDWTRCRVERAFRGDVYDIVIEKPRGPAAGAPRVTVDGRPIAGNLIAPFNDGRRHAVAVTL